MKSLVFYEVNETTSSMKLFTHFPKGEPARDVFDYINNQGAVTLTLLGKEFQDMSRMRLSQAVGALMSHKLITRRNLGAHDED